jgi:uncharacterized protein with PIN domain/sulfur carrier protein ThiS
MKQATFRFYAELNYFLQPRFRQVPFRHSFAGRVSVKHLIESLGVPHSEVDLILVNGASVDFSYIVEDGDRVSVYPVFESIDISTIGRLRPHPLRETRFILDIHLGQLATYLRLFGFDTLYQNDYSDDELARISSTEQRILLTKDRGLLKRNLVTHGYCVREDDPEKQLLEVFRRFDLRGSLEPFKRCLRCNGILRPVDKAEIIDRIPANTRQFYEEFHLCTSCDQVYWKGSHYRRMNHFIQRILENSS